MNDEKKITDFDKQVVFNKEIKPLLEEIYKLCYLYEIPFYSCFCVKGDSETNTNEYAIKAINPDLLNLKTEDKRFVDYFRYNKGFTENRKDVFNFTDTDANFDFGKLKSYQEDIDTDEKF